MATHKLTLVSIVLSACVTAHAQSIPPLPPYPLPAEALRVLEELAVETDILVLGELHGTQEVPQVCAALLSTLSQHGYGVVALEVPADQQAPLIAWATGKTETVPRFFNKEVEDGRGSVQLLSLIRQALAPPFRWQLICFDQAWNDEAYDLHASERDFEPKVLSEDALIAVQNSRDAQMAATLIAERKRLAPKAKVLAACGNQHAQTTNTWPADHFLSKLWPTFAAAVQLSQPEWRVRSVNIRPHGGASFCMTQKDDGPQPRTGAAEPIHSKTHPRVAEARRLTDSGCDAELDLPRATPATFLAFSYDYSPEPEVTGSSDSLARASKLSGTRLLHRQLAGRSRMCWRRR